jgi:hypothetical protein
MNKSIHNPDVNVTLREQLIEESAAMAKCALASGLGVPGDIVETLEAFTNQKITVTGPEGELAKDKPTEDQAQRKLDIRELNTIHAKLARIVEPAKPRTILLLDKEGRKKGFFKFLGPVPFIRRMILAALICLVLFIVISLSPIINDKENTWDMFKHNGFDLLLKELFLLCAAGLGAAFTALFRANRYIADCTFDPKYESSYWVRFTLGIIAGMILATLIPIENAVESDFAKPLLAMLGGFSALVVYRIIERLVEAVASFVRGDPQRQLESQTREIKTKAAENEAKNRFKLASDLMKVQDQIGTGMKTEEIKKKIGSLIGQLTNTGDGGVES